MLDNAATATTNGKYAHGLDHVYKTDGPSPLYHGDKDGLLSTSGNSIYFKTGEISYAICRNWQARRDVYLRTGAENWYHNDREFKSLLRAARNHDWSSIDLFPEYGMTPLRPI